MFLTGAFCIFAVVAVYVSEKHRREKNRLKDELDSLDREYCDKLADKTREYQREKVAAEKFTGNTYSLLRHGHQHLDKKVRKDYVSVVGTYPDRTDMTFIVKKFFYDPKSQEDKEFAIRCADELIETIQNA